MLPAQVTLPFATLSQSASLEQLWPTAHLVGQVAPQQVGMPPVPLLVLAVAPPFPVLELVLLLDVVAVALLVVAAPPGPLDADVLVPPVPVLDLLDVVVEPAPPAPPVPAVLALPLKSNPPRMAVHALAPTASATRQRLF